MNEKVALAFGLDAFSQNCDVKLATHFEDAADDRLACSTCIDAAHEIHVKPDDIGLKLRQQV